MNQDDPISLKERVALDIAEQAYADIERKYGEKGLSPRSYHNVRHAKDVVDASISIIDKAITLDKMRVEDKALAIIAGSHHDIEQDLGSGENEKASAVIATERMRQSGLFSEEEVERVSVAIVGTTVFFDNGKMFQSAGNDPLSRAIADGDLSNLGQTKEHFLDRSKRIYHENDLDGKGKDKFLAFEKELLTNHTFYTTEAAELFPHQVANLAYIAEII